MAIAALTMVALALRLAGIDQSLFGDELFTYRVVTSNSFWEIVPDVADTSITPPLHYLLAWLPVQLGDPTITIRLPSVILGTATVPLVYVLGLRTVGPISGLVGAALVAITPYAIFFGVEGRAYATLTFLCVLSTVALLEALRRGGPVSWCLYAASTTATLYTHYTGIFVVVAQLGWALWAHRDRARPLALATGAVVVAYLPWVPAYFEQRDLGSAQAETFVGRFPPTADTVVDMVAHVVPGYPLLPPAGTYLSLADLPGHLLVALVWGTIGLALVTALVRSVVRRRQAGGVSSSSQVVLIVVLALATPVGLVVYSLQPDTSFLVARNLSASLPAFGLLVGWALTSLPRPVAAVATATLFAALVVSTVRTLDDDHQRSPYDEVARFLDDTAGPQDVVFSDRFKAIYLPLYFERQHNLLPPTDAVVWERAARGERALLVTDVASRVGGPQNRVALRREKKFAGYPSLAVGYYHGELRARLLQQDRRREIQWSQGPSALISSGEVLGVVETVSLTGPRLVIRGWAIDASGRRPAELVSAFTGGRLLGIGKPDTQRRDIAQEHGDALLFSGYTLTARADRRTLANLTRLRVFGVVGSRASELTLAPMAKRTLAELSESSRPRIAR